MRAVTDRTHRKRTMTALIYFLISLFSTVAGAVTGMGGGVIIKPALDLLNQFNAETVSVLSSLTVFAMSVVAVGKHVQQKTLIPYKAALPLASGAVLGGVAGQWGLTLVVAALPSNRFVFIVQNAILVLLTVCVFVYMQKKSHIKTLYLNGLLAPLPVGLALGFFASFLGIGGGPFNVAVLMYLFSMSIKSATVCSIVVILFSQFTKMTTIALMEGFAVYDLRLLPPMILGGLIGGFAGAWLSRMMSEKCVERVFNAVQMLVLLICVYNIVQNLFFVPA